MPSRVSAIPPATLAVILRTWRMASLALGLIGPVFLAIYSIQNFYGSLEPSSLSRKLQPHPLVHPSLLHLYRRLAYTISLIVY